jgi:hypothetical protein
MPYFVIERENNRLLISSYEDINSTVSSKKVLGDSQIAQLLDLLKRQLPEYDLYPIADERILIDNDEFDVVESGTDQYRLILKNGQTTYDQYDLTQDQLRELVEALQQIRDDMEGEEEIGGILLSSVAGPTGPPGPIGPTGPSGFVSSDSCVVVKSIDQEVSEDTSGDSIVLRDDDELFFLVGPDEVWTFCMTIFVRTESISSGIKMSVNAPSNLSLFIASFLLRDNTDDTIGPNGPFGSVITVPDSPVTHDFSGAATGTVDTSIQVHGSLRVGSEGGAVRFRWAQSNEDAVPLVVRAGSNLIARRAQ